MASKKIAGADLLRSLLGVLVDEWGYGPVRDCLDALGASDEAQSLEASRGAEKRSRKTEKPTARSLAAKISLPPEQKRLIQSLAERYDSKLFLPTAGDIRYFFEIHGETPPSSKQRSEAFRRVLKVLSAMRETTLQKIIEDDAHTGPSRLGPLSEAMRSVGEQRSIGRDLTPGPATDSGGNVETNRGGHSEDQGLVADDDISGNVHSAEF
jgi:hypothetical protein